MHFFKITIATVIINSYMVALSCESSFSLPSGGSPNDGFKKENSFPDIKAEDQQAFEDHLSIASFLPSRFPPLDQCHKSCAAFSFARLVDYFMEGSLSGQISPGYLVAKTFEEKFRLELLSGQDYLTESTSWKIIGVALKRNGLLFEDDYPSNPQVNTIRLLAELKKLSLETRKKLNSYTPLNEAEQIQNASLEEASQLVQSFFGVYSKDVVDTSIELLNTVKQRGVSAKIQIAEFPGFSDFAKFSSLMLKNSIPILLTYNAAPRLLDPSGQYLDHASVKDNTNNLHGLVIIGEAFDDLGGRYFIAENSHANAQRLYIYESYLLNAFRSAHMLVDTKLIQQLIDEVPGLQRSLEFDGEFSKAFEF